jgi:hypothetical protein
MGFVAHYEAVISWIMWRASFGPDKLVHVFAGMVIWLGAGVVLRRRLGSVLPLVAVGLAEGGNEIVDYVHGVGWTFIDTVQDIVFTLFWPVAISVARRFCRWL